MRVNNQTNNPVEWEQTGSGGSGFSESQGQSGQLNGLQESPPFTPVGTAPWVVTFTAPGKTATSPGIKQSQETATVTLNADWTVAVS